MQMVQNDPVAFPLVSVEADFAIIFESQRIRREHGRHLCSSSSSYPNPSLASEMSNQLVHSSEKSKPEEASEDILKGTLEGSRDVEAADAGITKDPEPSADQGGKKQSDSTISGKGNSASNRKKPSSSAEDDKKKREMNPMFADLKETGRWGNISRKEVILTVSLILAVIIAVVVAIVVVNSNEDNESSVPAPATPPGTTSPTPAPLPPPNHQQRFDKLRQELLANPLMEEYAALLPASVDQLEGLQQDSTQDPVVRAASWTALTDQVTSTADMMIRFGLAVVYYANGGEQWGNQDKWLDPVTSVCDGWSGITCNLVTRELDEIDLAGNNLTGNIHNAMSMVATVRILWLNGNRLTGAIPGDVFASLKRLFILYLQNNELEGDIPVNLIDNGVLQTIFVHGNNLTGTWPVEFCGVVREFRLGCNQTPCPPMCCNLEVNCFD